MKKYVLVLAIILLFGIALSGCGKKAADDTTAGTGASDTVDTGATSATGGDGTGSTGTTGTSGEGDGTAAGIANPASVYCEERGFELEIRDEQEGQAGYCKFPDGSECEEWAYYRGECAPGAGIVETGEDTTPPGDEEPAETPGLGLTQSDLDKLKADIEGIEAEDLGGLSDE